MKSTWIHYSDWKRRIDDFFNYVEELLTHYFTRRVLRLKDAMDIHWINCIEPEISANHIKDWEQLEEAIIRRMDKIFPIMKKILWTGITGQKNGKKLHTCS